MNTRLLVLLPLCALLLTACYRQTAEPFQQVDSAEVVVAVTPTSIEAVVEDGTVSVNEQGEALAETTPQYVTPELVPGQVEQPTVVLPTAVVIGATSPAEALTPFLRPTVTAVLVEELDPNDECVYTVQAGDNLFRLSLTWDTTVDEIMTASQIESDALSIGQLLLRPGCEYSAPTARPTTLPAPVAVNTEAPEATAADGAEDETEPEVEAQEQLEVEPVDTATPQGPRVHVVSSGETIESISLQYRVDVNRLIALNNLTNPNRLLVGQELLLPD